MGRTEVQSMAAGFHLGRAEGLMADVLLPASPMWSHSGWPVCKGKHTSGPDVCTSEVEALVEEMAGAAVASAT